MKRTEGRRLLLRLLTLMTQEELVAALAVGVPMRRGAVAISQQAISTWKCGAVRPEIHWRTALRRVAAKHGIEMHEDTWLTAGELAIARGQVPGDDLPATDTAAE